jgi:4-hydroxybenzoate polyprenyltransferase
MLLRPRAHSTAFAGAEDAAIVRRYLSCIRYGDVLVLQGSPLLGAIFAMEAVTADRLAALVVFTAASLLLVAHVFVLNDWAGVDADLNDAHRVADVFATKGVSRKAMRGAAVALLALSLGLFGILGTRLLVIALAITTVSFFYSRSSMPAKGIPVLGSILHLVGGFLHFLLGFSLFRAIDERGLTLAVFFGLAFAAGHLNQEVRDFEGDVRNGIKTNAAMFGKAPTFIAGLVLFTLAYAHLVLMAAFDLVPRGFAVLGLFYVLHLYWSWEVVADGLSFENIRRFQVRYRAIYAVIGAAMLAALLISLGSRVSITAAR